MHGLSCIYNLTLSHPTRGEWIEMHIKYPA